MARNHAAKVRQGLNPKNGKATSSASERGAYGRSRPRADRSVRRAREVANDPRLQKAKEDQARHEEELRALEATHAARPAEVVVPAVQPELVTATVLHMPEPTPEPMGELVPLAAHVGFVNLTRPTPNPQPATPAGGKYVSRKPHPAAWAEAVRIVEKEDGDRRRIEVVDARTVIVHNRPV